jgi:hypothetical protein
MADLTVDLKRAAQAAAKPSGIALPPGFNATLPGLGKPARELLVELADGVRNVTPNQAHALKVAAWQLAARWRVKVPQGFDVQAPQVGAAARDLLRTLAKATAPTSTAPRPQVRHDFHAVHDSGVRDVHAIRYVVMHDGEVADADRAAAIIGVHFEDPTSQGSAHYGVDNGSVQQYLSLDRIPWGAPPLNAAGIHIEQGGLARYSRRDWLAGYMPMLLRVAELLAWLYGHYRVPLVHLSDDVLRAMGPTPTEPAGIVTHAQVTEVFRQSDHTDPGPAYPLDMVLLAARAMVR